LIYLDFDHLSAPSDRPNKENPMARGDKKKGREDKKPKQSGLKLPQKSAYSQRLNETGSTSLKIRSK
jgi:hypothetical protein